MEDSSRKSVSLMDPLRSLINHTLFSFCQKEKLKQQKEYAKQIKEHNMKSIASIQRLPTKPQVLSSASRQKVRTGSL